MLKLSVGMVELLRILGCDNNCIRLGSKCRYLSLSLLRPRRERFIAVASCVGKSKSTLHRMQKRSCRKQCRTNELTSDGQSGLMDC